VEAGVDWQGVEFQLQGQGREGAEVYGSHVRGIGIEKGKRVAKSKILLPELQHHLGESLATSEEESEKKAPTTWPNEWTTW
jgi:hypothetical protein